MSENTTQDEKILTEETKPKKRGRKPNPEKRKGYFYEEEEEAFRQYIESTDQRFRDRIFREKLYPAFTIMVESIIRKYSLFTQSEDFEETFHDTMSHLITKINNFDFSKGFKVYSYCGTVCKNYLIYKRTKDIKRRNTMLSYEKLLDSLCSTLTDHDPIRQKMLFNTELINKTIEKIKFGLSEENVDKLTENERKVGGILVYILENWEDLFQQQGTNKFNKASVRLFLRSGTNLGTREIREAMKKYDELYYETKHELITE